MMKLGPLKQIPSLNFQSNGVIELYDAVSEISITLDGAVGVFAHCSFVWL